MRLRKNQSLLFFILLGLLSATILIAEQYDCKDCSIPEVIQCRGADSCNGYVVQDCSGCEFQCGIWIEGELYYGPIHDACYELPPV